MDLGFSRLNLIRAEATPAPLDYIRLIATLATLQAAGRTAAVEAALVAGTFATTHPIAALTEIYGAGPCWATAMTALGGSFHPEVATFDGTGSITREPR